MTQFTSRLSLTKPGGGSSGTNLPADPVDIDVINTNMDKIDANLGAPQFTSTTRPAAPMVGMLIYEMDTGNVSRWDGTTWATMAVSAGYASASRTSQSIANATQNNVNNWVRSTTRSINDTGWVNYPAGVGAAAVGNIVLSNGTYVIAVGMSVDAGTQSTGRSFVDISTGSTGANLIARNEMYLDRYVSCTQVWRVTSTSTGLLTVTGFQTTGATQNLTFSLDITRVAGL